MDFKQVFKNIPFWLFLIPFLLFLPRLMSFIGFKRASKGWGKLKVPYSFKDYRNRYRANDDLPF